MKYKLFVILALTGLLLTSCKNETAEKNSNSVSSPITDSRIETINNTSQSNEIDNSSSVPSASNVQNYIWINKNYLSTDYIYEEPRGSSFTINTKETSVKYKPAAKDSHNISELCAKDYYSETSTNYNSMKNDVVFRFSTDNIDIANVKFTDYTVEQQKSPDVLWEKSIIDYFRSIEPDFSEPIFVQKSWIFTENNKTYAIVRASNEVENGFDIPVSSNNTLSSCLQKSVYHYSVDMLFFEDNSYAILSSDINEIPCIPFDMECDEALMPPNGANSEINESYIDVARWLYIEDKNHHIIMVPTYSYRLDYLFYAKPHTDYAIVTVNNAPILIKSSNGYTPQCKYGMLDYEEFFLISDNNTITIM